MLSARRPMKLPPGIEACQLKWYGHIQKMGKDTLPKQTLTGHHRSEKLGGFLVHSWKNESIRARRLETDLWKGEQWRLGIGRSL